MEISPTNKRKEDKTTVKGKKRAQEIKEKSIFSSELQHTIIQEFQGSVEELLEDLKDQEKRFLDIQNLFELNKYKTMVQRVLKQILQEGFKTQTLSRTRKDRANFTVISEINAKLEEISTAIIRSSKGFDLMKAIDEIRGLIFDLVY